VTVWAAVLAVLVGALLPFAAYAADRGGNAYPAEPSGVRDRAGAGADPSLLHLCTGDGPITVTLGADGLPLTAGNDSGSGAGKRSCPLCWGLGPTGLLPAPVEPYFPANRYETAVFRAGESIAPPALFLSRLRSRAPPAWA